ncbi:unnamed protein product [Polarella glacialis]|uniref:Cysteine dioxygenase n=1 Tax=Polarella glacialis TaxID=89957 RepID=A0A813L8B8_POLGL|nr:unnamed protein product [Polarella glacialis]
MLTFGRSARGSAPLPINAKFARNWQLSRPSPWCHAAIGGLGHESRHRSALAAVSTATLAFAAGRGGRRSRGSAQRWLASLSSSSKGGEDLGPVSALWQLLRQERDEMAGARVGAQCPEFSNLQSILEVMDRLGPEDFRVSEKDAATSRSRSGVSYQEVYSGPGMTLAIFLLRAGARIPLHDHPGMSVYGRLLFGRMRVRSFDAQSPIERDSGPLAWFAQSPASSGRKAVLQDDRVIGPLSTSYSLGPTEKNLHELEAIDHCAFFDILTPSYDGSQGRDCSYFQSQLIAGSEGGFLLKQFLPQDFDMDFQQYRGPPFV